MKLWRVLPLIAVLGIGAAACGGSGTATSKTSKTSLTTLVPNGLGGNVSFPACSNCKSAPDVAYTTQVNALCASYAAQSEQLTRGFNFSTIVSATWAAFYQSENTIGQQAQNAVRAVVPPPDLAARVNAALNTSALNSQELLMITNEITALGPSNSFSLTVIPGLPETSIQKNLDQERLDDEMLGNQYSAVNLFNCAIAQGGGQLP
jgi:hypothetical protein